MSQLLTISILGLAYTAVLVVAQVLYKAFKLKAEHTRKFIHFSVGMIVVLAPVQFEDHWYVLASTAIFLALLLYLRREKLLGSLYQIDRSSVGDLLLPVAIYLNYLLVDFYDYELLFYLPLLILSVSDPAASLGGELFHKKKKSLQGAAFFMLTALLSSWIYLNIFSASPYAHQMILLLCCAILGAIVELISKGGWDNLTVPLTIGSILIVYYEWILG